MALTNLQKNTLSNLQDIAQRLLTLKGHIDLTVQQYYNELYPGLTAEPPTIVDADLQAVVPFEHIATGEIVNAIAALQALQTWGGSLDTGNWSMLLRMLQSGIKSGTNS